ncbi:MAG: AAA family ATPase [Betaproteobacteria bacterium]|nr:AAA family ATPase [Betaproteobacteria bacterium]
MTTKATPLPPPEIPTGPLFSQLAGMPEARQWGEDLAKDIALYRAGKMAWTDIDAGIVVHGPPGTGKTTFARALAATARLPLIATTYAEWSEAGNYVGDVVAAMKRTFALAHEHAPCVVAIDELDSLPSRAILKSEKGIGTHMLVNALLAELDGLNGRTGIVIVATCNHPDKLDPALVRPGRLGRSIRIGLPGLDAIPHILAYHIAKGRSRVTNLPGIAILCHGMSGAEIEQLVREARQAMRRAGQTELTDQFLLRILEARAAQLSAAEQWVIAVHEAGHAIAAHYLMASQDITLSILPGGGRLGHCATLSARGPVTRKTIEPELATLLAGRAAEEVLIGEVSSGAGGSAESDLARASELALTAVTLLGLSQTSSVFWHGSFQSLGIHHVPTSLVAEARDIVQSAYQQATSIVSRHQSLAKTTAELLVKQRALPHAAFQELVRRHEAPAPRRLIMPPFARDTPVFSSPWRTTQALPADQQGYPAQPRPRT